jgi:IS5 family transposase
LQRWFNLSDAGVEEALYDFAGYALFCWMQASINAMRFERVDGLT